MLTPLLKVTIKVESQSGSSDETSTTTQPEENALPSPDTALWNSSSMTDHMRLVLVKKGPDQVKDRHFPKDASNRHFSNFHYTRILNNRETVHRSWLVYSIKNNAVFCFCCMLFGEKIIHKL